MQDHTDDPYGDDDGARSQRAPDRPVSGLSRIAAGGAVLARRAPAAAPTQAASGTPGTHPAPRSAAIPTWPVLRPRPAVPGGPGPTPPKVDAGTRSQGAPPAAGPDRPRVDARAQARPGAATPGEDPAKVDARATPLETFDPMPAPTRHRPILPVRPGMAGSAQARPSGPILPSADRVSAVRLARKAALGEGRDNGVLPLPGDEPARTAKTVDAYRVRGDQLVKRYRRENEIPDDVDAFNPREFAIWLLSLRGTLKPPSWRLYRQAALMVLGGMPGERAQEAMTLIEGDAPAEAEMGTGEPVEVPGAERLTSARKVKRFKYEDYVRIWHLMKQRRSKSAVVLQDWMRAGIATGLRPIEWRATEVVRVEDAGHPMGRRVFLLVLNAKATNGRSNGVVRTLDITAFSDGAVAVVQRMSDQGLRAYREGRYREFQGQAAQMLYEACRKLWPRRQNHYALYSCRHQFIANHKALGLPNEEVSAMSGHRVDDTVAHNYARSRTAWSPDKITERARGVQEEIATVKKVLHIWEGRLQSLRIVKQGFRVGSHDDGDEVTVPMADL